MGLTPDPLGAADHRARGVIWRQAARDLLGPITAPLAVAPGAKPAWSDVVRIDERRVLRADQCLAQPAADGDDYAETTRNARRRTGLAVLGVMRSSPGLDPLTAFEEVMAHRTHWFAEPLVAWIDGLPPGGLAALAQEAVGYAVALTSWVPPSRMGDVAIAGPSDAYRWDLPERAVRIQGRCDAVSPRRGLPPSRRLLVTANHLAAVDVVAGHAALAYTLATGSVPGRVTVLAPASGKQAVAVDDGLLEAALGRVGAAAHGAVAARFGPPATTSPGRWCRSCSRLDECDDGRADVDARPIRIGGLRPDPPG